MNLPPNARVSLVPNVTAPLDSGFEKVGERPYYAMRSIDPNYRASMGEDGVKLLSYQRSATEEDTYLEYYGETLPKESHTIAHGPGFTPRQMKWRTQNENGERTLVPVYGNQEKIRLNLKHPESGILPKMKYLAQAAANDMADGNHITFPSVPTESCSTCN